MPKLFSQCTVPSNFDSGRISGFKITFRGYDYCVAECSDPKQVCLTGSTCMTAPTELTND